MVLKIITSIYELNYEDGRGGMVYKSFPLLTQTIRNIIFDEFEYVIYTNKFTYDKHNLSQVFNKPNIIIKFKELNDDFYSKIINPIREKFYKNGDIFDRIFSVKNYVEVMYNKFEFLIDESKNFDGNVVWVDSGLFGTSCHDGWRDYMNVLSHSKFFLDKINEKINLYNFICLKGDGIAINYELRDRINSVFNVNPCIISGGLFGGKSNSVIEIFSQYKNIITEMINKNQEYTSDQEILSILTNNKDVKFFEFGDWIDLQRAFLKIMDVYDEEKYSTHTANGVLLGVNLNNQEELKNIKFSTFTELANILGIDKGSLHENHMYTEVYEEYLTKFKSLTPIIFEIGVNDSRFPGGCLKFWDLIFKKMEYYGYDITDCSSLIYNNEKIKLIQGDQNSVEDLNRGINQFSLSNKIDVIIDDGSHISEHIITSFNTLYPHLKDGGYYFIEDLHAGCAEREKTINEIKSIIDTNNFKLTNMVLKCNDKLLILEK